MDNFTENLLSVKYIFFLFLNLGESLSAQQNDFNHKIIHQIEFDNESGGCFFRSANGKLWTIVTVKDVEASATEKNKTTLFDLEYSCDGKISIKKKYTDSFLTISISGKLMAKTTDFSINFCLKIVNRPIILLRTEHGWIGPNTSGELECNKAVGSIQHLEQINDEHFIYGLYK